MRHIWISTVTLASLATLLSACGATDDGGYGGNERDEGYESDDGYEGDEIPEQAAKLEDLDGSVLGRVVQHMTYPYCVSAASDPDGDG